MPELVIHHLHRHLALTLHMLVLLKLALSHARFDNRDFSGL